MAKLSEVLEKITESKENKKDKDWEEYKKKCLAHWKNYSKSILLYFEELKTKYKYNDSISITFADNPIDALENIPHWSYAPSNKFKDNFTFYLNALNISYKLSTDFSQTTPTKLGIFICLDTELPECTQIPDKISL